ncbi:MAG: hypothetical protein WDO71_14235 [Bacteroidota bacterium]
MKSISLFHWDETTGIDDLYDLINCFEDDEEPVAFDINQDSDLYHIRLH